MAQDIKSAVSDLIETLIDVEGLKVQTTNDEPGPGYTLSATLGDYAETPIFGATKKAQSIDLVLYCSGPNTNTLTALDKCQEINAAITLDRRRGQFAQTTLVSNWESESSGRDGTILNAVAEIHTNETD